MKAFFKCGLCLLLGVWISRAGADELQWRKASLSQIAAAIPAEAPPIADLSGSSAPSVRLLPATPMNLQTGIDPFPTRPATVRAQNAEEAKPSPPQVKVFAAPFVPSSGDDPGSVPSSQVPTVPTEKIPVEPTPLEATPLPQDGTTIIGSCDCGVAGQHVWDAGSSTCCPSDGCCFSNCCCYNANRNHMWFSAEYLLWQFSRPNTPALVTTGSANDLIPTALGQPNTRVLYGDGGSFSNFIHSGGRFDLGFWFPGCEDEWGLELGALFLAPRTTTFSANSGVLGRPFLNVTNPPSFQDSEPINGFAGTTGSVRIDYTSELWGVEANLRHKLCCNDRFRLDMLAGFRNLNLKESITINENLAFDENSNQITDRFATSNNFYGGQFGLDGEYRFCNRWFIGGTLKLAFGEAYQSVNIAGTQVLNGTPYNSGVFANYTTNSGSYSRNAFCFVPEATLKFGVDITERLRLFVGYNFLFMSNAVRPGDAIDPTINTSLQMPGGATSGTPARPVFVFRNSDFWAQGMTAGLEYHY